MRALAVAVVLALAPYAQGRPRSVGGGGRRPQAQLFIERAPTAQEAGSRDTHAKYEPPSGCYLGGYIDFDRTLKRTVLDFDRKPRRDPGQFEERVGKKHAM